MTPPLNKPSGDGTLNDSRYLTVTAALRQKYSDNLAGKVLYRSTQRRFQIPLIYAQSYMRYVDFSMLIGEPHEHLDL